jgi:hypothetical protein
MGGRARRPFKETGRGTADESTTAVPTPRPGRRGTQNPDWERTFGLWSGSVGTAR